jgi:hypothetical protein
MVPLFRDQNFTENEKKSGCCGTISLFRKKFFSARRPTSVQNKHRCFICSGTKTSNRVNLVDRRVYCPRSTSSARSKSWREREREKERKRERERETTNFYRNEVSFHFSHNWAKWANNTTVTNRSITSRRT